MNQTNRQRGSLHMIVLITLFVGIVGLVAARYYTASNDVRAHQVDATMYLSSIPPDVLEYQKILDVAHLHHGRSSVSAVMIRKINHVYVYEIRYVDQASLRIDAQSGMTVAPDESVAVSTSRRVLSKVSPVLSFETARKTAVNHRKGASTLAVEYVHRNDLPSYSVYFEDDRRVDIDANSGAVVVYR